MASWLPSLPRLKVFARRLQKHLQMMLLNANRKSLLKSAQMHGFIAELQQPSQNSTLNTVGWMQFGQKARTRYMVKNGNQQRMNPPTMMPSVFAAFVSIRNFFTCNNLTPRLSLYLFSHDVEVLLLYLWNFVHLSITDAICSIRNTQHTKCFKHRNCSKFL